MAIVTTSHYKIFEYWRDKVITSGGEIVNVKDEYGVNDKIVVDDDYCPRCWGCGALVVRDSKIDEWISKQCADEDEESNLKRIWSSKETRSKLNRCHIIPGALGGADEPSNLFLMCSECHTLSPDTTYPSMFFKWVVERREQMVWGTWSPEYIFQRVGELLKRDYGISLMELLGQIHELGGDDKIGNLQGFMKNRIGTHGNKISESSAMVAVEQWLMSIYTELALK